MAEGARTPQAIISFGQARRSKEIDRHADCVTDGGGIRGCGSLLILRALMEKVGIEERRIDSAAKAGFAPCMYEPTEIGFSTSCTEDIQSVEANDVTETNSRVLSNDSLFLPCHYFYYGAGTSTGGGNYVTNVAR